MWKNIYYYHDFLKNNKELDSLIFLQSQTQQEQKAKEINKNKSAVITWEHNIHTLYACLIYIIIKEAMETAFMMRVVIKTNFFPFHYFYYSFLWGVREKKMFFRWATDKNQINIYNGSIVNTVTLTKVWTNDFLLPHVQFTLFISSCFL